MDGLLVRPDIKDSGTTNISGLTWTRDGDVVEVCLYNISVSPTPVDVMGLPKPKQGYAIFKLFSVANTIGWLEHSQTYNQWKLGGYSSGTIYGTYTYIAE